MSGNKIERKINPYTPSFGKSPTARIPRVQEKNRIIENFMSEPSPQNAFMIVGVRGSGKTVFLYEMAHEFEKSDEWVVVSLNTNRDMLSSLLSKLYSHRTAMSIIQSSQIDLSFWGFGISISGSEMITDVEVAIEKIVAGMRSKHKKLLITVDEASNTEYMKVFASTFQDLLGKNMPVYLLMTGLFENINSLRNERNLTFLYRMPRIELVPLKMDLIADNYMNIFSIDPARADEMAALTRGYSYGFQTLGDLTWNSDGNYEHIIPEYRAQLEEYVYDKIWSELSENDKTVAYGIALSDIGKVKEIRDIIGFNSNSFTQYRERLLKRGLLTAVSYGYLDFSLPFFRGFVKKRYEAEHNQMIRKGIFADL